MSAFAYLDLCFYERCNLACDYCRRDNEGMARGPSLEEFVNTVEKFLAHSEAAVLKVSGYGEATLWPYLREALEKCSSRFPAVQVMTNGTSGKETISALAGIGNISFCITIDGHTMQANQHRSHQRVTLHDKMLSMVDHIVSIGKPLEINCVVTRSNIDQIVEFAHCLQSRYGAAARLMPFPVRPFVGLKAVDLFPERTQVDRLAERVGESFGEIAAVLPPREYMQRLLEFLKRGKRSQPCHVAAANFGVGPALEHLVCACAGHSQPSLDQGNIAHDDQKVGRQRRHSKGIIDPRCWRCFNHYELLNLFLAGVCSVDLLTAMPAFSFAGVRETLERMKAEVELDDDAWHERLSPA